MAITTERIEIDPTIMMGKPVIREDTNHRRANPAQTAEGASGGEMLEDYRHLTTKDIRAAVAYGEARLAHG